MFKKRYRVDIDEEESGRFTIEGRKDIVEDFIVFLDKCNVIDAYDGHVVICDRKDSRIGIESIADNLEIELKWRKSTLQ